MIDEPTFRRASDAHSNLSSNPSSPPRKMAASRPKTTNGVLNVLFEDGSTKFVFTPQTPVRQVWISARTTSFKLDWDEATKSFLLPKTGETLKTLTQRLLQEQLDDPSISLS